MLPREILNKRNDATIRFVSADNDPWGVYRERYVEFVHQNNSISGGVYRGISTLGKLVLAPFVEMRTLTHEEQQTHGIRFTLHWNEDTLLASHESVVQAIPRIQEHLDKILSHYRIHSSPALTWDI